MTKKLNYILSGEGEKTILYLHGWGMNKDCFTGFTSRLNTKAKNLIVDFYGFGDSDEPESYYDTYEYAYQIFLLLSRLEIKDIVLVGHSFGGRVAIILSAIFDIKVSAMILTSSAGLNRFSLKKTFNIFKYRLIKKLVKYKLLRPSSLSKYGSSDYKRLSSTMKRCFVKIVKQDLSYLLKNIECKTILFWAKDDKDTPMWICKKLNKNISNSKVLIMKSGGHFCFLKNFYKFSDLIYSLV